jgi:threonine dehydrogenase-like Zn-dependent dehydrogenase
MARRDDDRDEPRRDEDRGTPTAVLVLGLLVLLVLGLGVVGGMYWLLSARQSAQQAVAMHEQMVARERAEQAAARQPVPPADRPAPLTRDEFKAKVMGKTPEQVIEAVGNPDRKDAEGADSTWHYDRRTIGPGSKAADATARLAFKDGVVAVVHFN